jgi:hypothetical protein
MADETCKCKENPRRSVMNSWGGTLIGWGLCAAFLLPAVSSASVIFSNFGPGQSYNDSVGNVSGNAFDGLTYAQGDTFTPAANAVFGELQIALSCSASCPDPFTVAITGDSGSDYPGTVIESFTVAGSSLGPTGTDNAPLVLDSSLMPRLIAGTQYWVTVSADLSDSVAWNLNSSGDVSDEAISTDDGATWFSPSLLTPGAYEVETIPEPGTIILMAGALLLLWLTQRYRLRRRV